jgi:hypothetical protein
MYEKLKSLVANDTLFTAVLVLLVGVVSFGLGRQSVFCGGTLLTSATPAGVVFTDIPDTPKIRESQIVEPSIIVNATSTVPVVASRSGKRYHRQDCPGAAQIKEENKLFFDTTELARAAGYTPAANCPGLQ